MDDQVKHHLDSSTLSHFAGESNECAAESSTRSTVQREKRGAPRRRMFKKAELEIAGNFGNIPCLVRNSSHTGALIEVDGNFVIPERFDLIIPMDGTRVKCELVRMQQKQIGLRYISRIIVFKVPEKQAIQSSSDECFKNITRVDKYYVDPPGETELPIRRHGNKTVPRKPGFGKR